MNSVVKAEYEILIFQFRGFKVMVDTDLALLYGVPTKALKQQVKRNQDRFPEDFMFELSKIEKDELVTICDRLASLKHSSINLMVFTEQGVAMLSGIIRSQQAVDVNISIMRAFVHMRQFIIQNREILLSIDELRQRVKQLEQSEEEMISSINDLSEDTRREMDDIYIALAEMAKKKSKPEKFNPIGFVKNNES